MDTLIGKSLSHYRIIEMIGAGGMGRVYRAHDTRLGRDVAIKALPTAVSNDPDRLLRFEREARVLASLNHPNIAGIHGVEEIDGHRYLVLEFVEGDTLAARIAGGPLPVADTVEIGIQIAAGMEAAHEAGVVHRDLKPGNVMITPGDQVKVVDFGLAKGAVPGTDEAPSDAPTVTASPVLVHSPTIGAPATLPGVVLGTAAYLSPEQARGKVVDRRSDVWSFGCVLYECLTGRRAFQGETVSDVIAAVLSRDVDWSDLPRDTPARLRDLLRQCLAKDPRKRLRDLGDARLTLEEIRERKEEAASPVPRRSHARRTILTATGLTFAATAAALALWAALGPGRAADLHSTGVKRLAILLPEDIQLTLSSISSDGRALLAHGLPRTSLAGQPARARFYRRRLDVDRFEPIPGTEGGIGIDVSPNSPWFYFVVPLSDRAAEYRLMRVRLDADAPPISVMNWNSAWHLTGGVALHSGDLLVCNREQDSFVRITPAGGLQPPGPTKITMPEFQGSFALWSALPGDRGVLANTTSHEGDGFQYGTALVDPKTGRAKMLLRDGGNAYYAPTGHLVFSRRSMLLAVPFDLKQLEVRGEPVVVLEGLRIESSSGHALFTLSREGTLVYGPGGVVGANRRLIIVGHDGGIREWSPERAFLHWSVDADPTGTHAAVIVTTPKGVDEIWVWERGRPSSRRISIPGFDCTAPAWSWDGGTLAFFGPRGTVYAQALDGGAPKPVSRLDPPDFYTRLAWSPDGSTLLATKVVSYFLRADIDRVQIGTGGAARSTATPFLAAPDWRELRASFSPDGKWITYQSNESGRHEIYVAPYRADGSMGAPLKISTNGGEDPRWGRRGSTVYFRPSDQLGGWSPRRDVVSVDIEARPALSADRPVPRWDLERLRVVNDGGPTYDLLPTGEMLAIQKGDDESELTHAEVVTGFFDLVREKAGAGQGRGGAPP